MEQAKNKIVFGFKAPIWEHPFIMLLLGFISLIITVILVIAGWPVVFFGWFGPLAVIPWIFYLLAIAALLILDLYILYGAIVTIIYWIYLASGKAPFWKEHFEKSALKAANEE